jgi:hypothetical protein
MQYYKCIKERSTIRGYWQDNQRKVYRDFIAIKDYYTFKDYLSIREDLQTEKALFFVHGEQAFILAQSGAMDFLNNRIVYQVKKLLPSQIKVLLAKYNGLTIFKTTKGYTIEIWIT